MDLVVLLLAASVMQGEPGDPYRETELDLAALSPGQEHHVVIPVEQPYRIVIANRVPTAEYAITVIRPVRNPRWDLQVRSVDRDNLDRQLSPGQCPKASLLAERVLSASDEAEVSEALETDGLAAALRDDDHCRGLLNPILGATRRLLWQEAGTGRGKRGEVVVIRKTLDPTRDGPSWRFVIDAGSARAPQASQTEEQWIISRVTRQVTELLLLAAGRAAAVEQVRIEVGGRDRDYQRPVLIAGLRPDPVETQVWLDEFVWSPAGYEDFVLNTARALELRLLSRPHRSAPSGESRSLLERLADPTALLLAREARAVAHRLREAPFSSAAHEQAALIVASFALREQGGLYGDMRPLLCRIAAHLAIARILAGGSAPGEAGTVAAAVLDVLAGRQAAALERAELLAAANDAPTSAWGRALRLRANGDWRAARAPATTLIEQRELYLALARGLNGLHALASLPPAEEQHFIEWARISLDSGPTVHEGNIFAGGAVLAELHEASVIYEELHGRGIEANALLTEMGPPSERFVVQDTGAGWRPEVLGWGVWASSYGRHLANAAYQADLHLGSSLGLYSEADQAWAELKRLLRPHWLAPIVSIEVATRRIDGGANVAVWASDVARWREERLQACSSAAWLWTDAPQLLRRGLWLLLRRECAEAPAVRPSPPEDWFGRGLLPGTAFEAGYRPLASGEGIDEVRRRRELAPYDLPLLRWEMRMAKHGSVLDLPTARRIAGPRLDYDLSAIRAARDLVAGPGSERELLQLQCELDATSCCELGAFLVGLELEDEAAEAYERALDEGLDRVTVSARMSWLVEFHRNRTGAERALAIARSAAETGSSHGRVTLGSLLERLGRFEEAEEQFQAIQSHYGTDRHLLLFYLREARRHPDGPYSVAGGRARAGLGCDEMSPYSGVSGPRPPGVGVAVSSPRFRKRGLKPGSVVVGVEGFRVRSVREFNCALTRSDEPEVSLNVWSADGTVSEVQAPLRRPFPDLQFDP